MRLTDRLQTVADAAGCCKVLADIGTDHGYIPVYMLKEGLCGRCYASDIRKAPLLRAEGYIRENGFSEKTLTFLCDGITGIPEDYDVLVIAGMGGETIVSILDAKHPAHGARLVLQPMTEERLLRKYLYEHGYVITEETAVTEPGHVYTVITALEGFVDGFDEADILVSRSFRRKKSEAAGAYIGKLINMQKTRLNGLRKARSDRSAEAVAAEKELTELERILEEVSL